jgi:hypothetical protein
MDSDSSTDSETSVEDDYVDEDFIEAALVELFQLQIPLQSIADAIVQTCKLSTAQNNAILDELKILKHESFHAVTLIQLLHKDKVVFQAKANERGKFDVFSTGPLLRGLRPLIGDHTSPNLLSWKIHIVMMRSGPSKVSYALPREISAFWAQKAIAFAKKYPTRGNPVGDFICASEDSFNESYPRYHLSMSEANKTFDVNFADPTVCKKFTFMRHIERQTKTRSHKLMPTASHPTYSATTRSSKIQLDAWYMALDANARKVGNAVITSYERFKDKDFLKDELDDIKNEMDATYIGIPVASDGHAFSYILDLGTNTLNYVNSNGGNPSYTETRFIVNTVIRVFKFVPTVQRVIFTNYQQDEDVDDDVGRYGQCAVWTAYFLYYVCVLGNEPEEISITFDGFIKDELRLLLRNFFSQMQIASVPYLSEAEYYLREDDRERVPAAGVEKPTAGAGAGIEDLDM